MFDAVVDVPADVIVVERDDISVELKERGSGRRETQAPDGTTYTYTYAVAED